MVEYNLFAFDYQVNFQSSFPAPESAATLPLPMDAISRPVYCKTGNPPESNMSSQPLRRLFLSNRHQGNGCARIPQVQCKRLLDRFFLCEWHCVNKVRCACVIHAHIRVKLISTLFDGMACGKQFFCAAVSVYDMLLRVGVDLPDKRLPHERADLLQKLY